MCLAPPRGGSLEPVAHASPIPDLIMGAADAAKLDLKRTRMNITELLLSPFTYYLASASSSTTFLPMCLYMSLPQVDYSAVDQIYAPMAANVENVDVTHSGKEEASTIVSAASTAKDRATNFANGVGLPEIITSYGLISSPYPNGNAVITYPHPITTPPPTCYQIIHQCKECKQLFMCKTYLLKYARASCRKSWQRKYIKKSGMWRPSASFCKQATALLPKF